MNLRGNALPMQRQRLQILSLLGFQYLIFWPDERTEILKNTKKQSPAFAITISTLPWRVSISFARAEFPSTSAETHLTIAIRLGYFSAMAFKAVAFSGSLAPAYTNALSCVARMRETNPRPAFREF